MAKDPVTTEETEDDAPGIDEGELYGDEPEDPDDDGPELTSEPAEGSLFPGGKLPEGMESLAREMKQAELERKRLSAIEKDKRSQLASMMELKDVTVFQIDVDGSDYEFKLEEKAKVKSKKLKEEDE